MTDCFTPFFLLSIRLRIIKEHNLFSSPNALEHGDDELQDYDLPPPLRPIPIHLASHSTFVPLHLVTLDSR
ncbi:hypothetical protein GOBAR_AA09600 [Gossypium barbadense]|uniref:Uncharacterized protein n=1 Tax=Gossypium barbadense TaxID=3634 RepID=A0A2P5Y672_GOSBA|nr:hypothetical protein GOBAR_AA09600 [Gossypium barbadense]